MMGPMDEGCRCRVLVVEDHAVYADLLREMIELLGHEATVVHDIAGGKAADPQTYDLLMCDYSLPDGQGTELASHLRERKAPPLVLLSGYNAEDLSPDVAQLFDLCLTKPVDMDQLDEVLQRYRPVREAHG